MKQPTSWHQHPASLSAVLAGLCLGVVVAGCGKKPDAAALERQAELSTAGLVAESTSVSGRVVLLGGPPKILGQVICAGGDALCAQHAPLIDPAWKLDSEGGLADVVITVSGSQRAANLPAQPASIEQKSCEYQPTVIAVQAGESIVVRNAGPEASGIHFIRHQEGTLDKGETLENAAAAGQGSEWTRELRRPGIYRLECDARPWMRAWVVVHEGIHKAVTGLDGSYAIARALPDGEYEVQAWHPRFKKKLSKTVQVVNGAAQVDFAFDYSHSLDATQALDS